MSDVVIRSRRVLANDSLQPASVHISGGRIERIAAFDDVAGGAELDDYGELVIMPGIVDSHVHVNEPGRTDWEGFDTATRAAAAGGVTTIVDMPLNSIPATTSVDALQQKVAALSGKCHVDVGLWGGAVPGNSSELTPMLAAGALGFKCFLVESGVPEFGHLDLAGLRLALATLAPTGAPLLVHAELPGPIAAAAELLHGHRTSYARYLASRPPAAEDEAIAAVIGAARSTGAWAHIVHLSAAKAADAIAHAKNAGVRISVETTPHYLALDAEAIPDASPQFKCAPPIRERENREQLWEALADGVIDCIVSDHSPCRPELKLLEDGDVEHAWGGIASLQLALPIVWTECRRRGIDLGELSRWMSAAPAQLAGLGDRKGELAPGLDADLVAFDPDASFIVNASHIEHRHKLTPYEGRELHGVVRATYLRGSKVWADGSHLGASSGRWLRGRRGSS